jgi:hypothetical protein
MGCGRAQEVPWWRRQQSDALDALNAATVSHGEARRSQALLARDMLTSGSRAGGEEGAHWIRCRMHALAIVLLPELIPTLGAS